MFLKYLKLHSNSKPCLLMRFLNFSRYNNFNVSILCNGYLNFSKSLVININEKRYLINCGEGTQKLSLENRLSKNINNVFITRKTTKHISGLIGMTLSIANMKEVSVCIHGFREACDYLQIPFGVIKKQDYIIKYNKDLHFNDGVLDVVKFKYSSTKSENGECVGYLFSISKMQMPLRSDQAGLLKYFENDKFDKINPEIIPQAIDEVAVPKKCLVIECPSSDHISSMFDAMPWENFDDTEGTLQLVFHLTDKNLFDTPEYKEFIKRINSKIDKTRGILTHVVVDSQCKIPTSFSNYYVQTGLNTFFDSEVFPKLQTYEEYIKTNDSALAVTEVDVELVNNQGDSPYNVVYGEPLMQFRTVDNESNAKVISTPAWSQLKNLSEKSIIDEFIYHNESVPAPFMLNRMKELKEALVNAKESIGEMVSDNYPYVTFIGTSSTAPSKYRNISCILIQADHNKNLIFDVGENSLDRIIIMHGVEEANKIIRNLRMICISHEHLDHHTGLYLLLQYRQQIGQCQPCLLLAPRKIYSFTNEIDQIFHTDHCKYNCEWLAIDLLPIKNNTRSTNHSRKILDDFEKQLGLTLNPVRVFHTNISYGFVLTGSKTPGSNERWKITYSGDRTPKADDLVNKGMDSDLLIHEATMDDGLENLARLKQHCTVSQAIEEGIKMNAKFTILTHFSSRYVLVPPVETKHKNVAQAFDFMRINLQTCKYLKVLDDYLQYLFPTHWAELMTNRQKLMRCQQELRASRINK